MKAVVVENKGVVVVRDDVPVPQIGPYDALVRIKTCGFCNGTDMRLIHDEVSEEQYMQPFPFVLGHEAAGIVEQVGGKVKNLAVGGKYIRIVNHSFPGSPYASAHGQMAEYGVITDFKAMADDGLEVPADAPMTPCRLPDDFDLIAAGGLLPLCECLSAVRSFGIGPDTDVLIYGAGPMGLAMMQYMRIVGAKSITCIDSVPERLQGAMDVAKIDQAINFATEDVDKVLNGRLFDRVVDAVGLSSVIREGSFRLKPYGVMCCLGVLRKGDGEVDLRLLKNNTLVHMLNFPYQEYGVFEENVRYIQEGKIDPKNYYSHVLPMEEINRAMELVRTKEAIKVILTMD